MLLIWLKFEVKSNTQINWVLDFKMQTQLGWISNSGPESLLIRVEEVLRIQLK